MDYVFDSEAGERITVPSISQLVCDHCGNVCISMDSFDVIEEFVTEYYFRKAFEKKRLNQSKKDYIKKSYLPSPNQKAVLESEVMPVNAVCPYKKQTTWIQLFSGSSSSYTSSELAYV